MTLVDAEAIAERLGLPQEAVRNVQRHGFLRRLDLDECEGRERLCRGHLAFLELAQNVRGGRSDERRASLGSGVARPRAFRARLTRVRQRRRRGTGGLSTDRSGPSRRASRKSADSARPDHPMTV